MSLRITGKQINFQSLSYIAHDLGGTGQINTGVSELQHSLHNQALSSEFTRLSKNFYYFSDPLWDGKLLYSLYINTFIAELVTCNCGIEYLYKSHFSKFKIPTTLKS